MQESSTKKIYDVHSLFYDATFGRLVKRRIERFERWGFLTRQPVDDSVKQIINLLADQRTCTAAPPSPPSTTDNRHLTTEESGHPFTRSPTHPLTEASARIERPAGNERPRASQAASAASGQRSASLISGDGIARSESARSSAGSARSISRCASGSGNNRLLIYEQRSI